MLNFTSIRCMVFFLWKMYFVTYVLRSFLIWGFTFGSDQTLVMEFMVSYWQTFLVKMNFEILQKAHPCILLGNFFAILSISGYNSQSDPRYLSVKSYLMGWDPCQLGIYIWVWPDFCDRNCGRLLVTFFG